MAWVVDQTPDSFKSQAIHFLNLSCLINNERCDIKFEVLYTDFDALDIVKKNSDTKVVFLGVGFETTAPTIAASIMQAAQMKVDNSLYILLTNWFHRPRKH